MSNSIISQIEDRFNQLSISEQLRLIEHLVHRVQEATSKNRSDLDGQLALMANDPEIQTELQNIEREFSNAEVDGLETL
ncbi:MAG: hypothetical protein WCB68_00485 [Pyrinomonadaceae bacterium]